MAIGVHPVDLVCVGAELHVPGPGAMLSAQSEGKLSLPPIVWFFRFSLPRRLYSPGPGLWVWLKMETDLQSALPCPKEKPCFGLLAKSEASVYLSGDGTGLLLNEVGSTRQYQSYLRSRRRARVC